MAAPLIPYSTARTVATSHGTPVFVYDEARLRARAAAARAFPAPFGLTVRYAMKAAPTRALLRFFDGEGLHFDASSGHEAERLLLAGIEGNRISLSSQELPDNFHELVEMGVSVNACSLRQLDQYGTAFPGTAVGLRFNPGLGSGGTNRTNVGGPASSFGIWHEKTTEARQLAEAHRLNVFRIHTHIGSGSDPEVWKRTAGLSLKVAAAFDTVTHLNLGGGYKIARMEDERETDLQAIGKPVADLLREFAENTGRRLHVEIEPGTFLIANGCALLCRVQDVVDTGPAGYTFFKLDTGMTEILRPSLYGSQHPIDIIRESPGKERKPAIVVGHCCESGDILTPADGDSEALAPRDLPPAEPGDLVLIGGAGAYCSAMAAKNYNSFPEAPEVLLRETGEIRLIRRRQSLAQILQNELE